MSQDNLYKTLSKISPEAVSRFLSRKGYHFQGKKDGVASIHENSERQIIIAPLDNRSHNYAKRLLEIAELFVSDTSTLNDVVSTIVLPQSDTFRYRVETPETTWGHLRLNYTHTAMGALHDLLQFTAAGVSSQKRSYSRVSEQAKVFTSQCRFGQTELGSFILKIYCPTNPTNVRMDEFDDEPFGRVATKSVIENLDFLTSEKSEDPDELIPPTLNRNVAKAVERLRPFDRIGSNTDVQVHYASLFHELANNTEGQIKSAEHSAQVDLGPFIYSRAKSVAERLKKAEEFEREVFLGYITELHKDRPVSDLQQSHIVTLEVRSGLSWRNLKMRLLPSEYRRAVKWHDSNAQVKVDAIVDKRSKVWSVSKLIEFQPAHRNDNESSLFDR